jgi:hypothetical protein
MSDKPCLWKQVGAISIFREPGFSFGFDDIGKCYSLSSTDEWLSSVIKEGFYLDFFHACREFLFLRFIASNESWPTTSLVMFNLENRTSKVLFVSDSSFIEWPIEIVDYSSFRVVTDRPRNGCNRAYIVRINTEVFAVEERAG